MHVLSNRRYLRHTTTHHTNIPHTLLESACCRGVTLLLPRCRVHLLCLSKFWFAEYFYFLLHYFVLFTVYATPHYTTPPTHCFAFVMRISTWKPFLCHQNTFEITTFKQYRQKLKSIQSNSVSLLHAHWPIQLLNNSDKYTTSEFQNSLKLLSMISPTHHIILIGMTPYCSSI